MSDKLTGLIIVLFAVLFWMSVFYSISQAFHRIGT